MLKYYFKIAFRNLLKNPVFSLINIGGLSIGIACCLVIFQYVAFEYSFDRFHEHNRDLYRVLHEGERSAYTGYALGPALAESVPGIRHYTRLHPEAALVSTPDRPERVFDERRANYADPAFLKMFSFSLVAGNEGSALEPGTILISESAAQKYFSTENPIGLVLEWRDDDGIADSYRIAGVFRDVPENSSLRFDFLLPMENLLRDAYGNEPDDGWSWRNFDTFIQLQSGADRAAIEQKMTAVYGTQHGQTEDQTTDLSLQPLNDLHLDDRTSGSLNVSGSYRTVYFFSVIGLLTLLIALFNYINLSTARALNRAKEVGVRKVTGASRRQLVLQFLCESALINLLAIGLSVVLAELLRPFVAGFTGIGLYSVAGMDIELGLAIVTSFVLCTLLAGLYPAFVLSSFTPVSVLKGKAGTLKGQHFLRRGLVVLQFSISIVLIAGTAVMYNQLSYINRMDLGLDLEQVVAMTPPRVLPEGMDQERAIDTFVEELRRLPGIRQVAASSRVPSLGFNWRGANFRRVEDTPSGAVKGVVTYIDSDFIEVYGLELTAGNGFAEYTQSSANEVPWPVIANETAVKSLGFASPLEAINQPVDISGNNAYIVGVLRDFHWTSAHEAQQNIFFRYTETSKGDVISIQVNPGNLSGTIASVETIHSRLFPGNVFDYTFLDQRFDEQYRDEQQFARLYSVFTVLAIFISCLGLFGLVTFTARNRIREIGIRKVLGATAANIVVLLSRDFLRLVAVSFCVAVPVAWYAMNQWLQEFAYRIEPGPGIFLLAGTIAMLIALLTVSWQSIRAALANPANSLRSE